MFNQFCSTDGLQSVSDPAYCNRSVECSLRLMATQRRISNHAVRSRMLERSRQALHN